MAQFDSGLITGKANRGDQGDSSRCINSERCSWPGAGKQYMGYVYIYICVCVVTSLYYCLRMMHFRYGLLYY